MMQKEPTLQASKHALCRGSSTMCQCEIVQSDLCKHCGIFCQSVMLISHIFHTLNCMLNDKKIHDACYINITQSSIVSLSDLNCRITIDSMGEVFRYQYCRIRKTAMWYSSQGGSCIVYRGKALPSFMFMFRFRIS